MKLKGKLIRWYALLGMAGALVLSICTSYYMDKQEKTAIYNKVEAVSSQMTDGFDNVEQQMEQAAFLILSNKNSLEAIKELAVLMKNPTEHISDIGAAKTTVRTLIGTAYNYEYFYRVHVFNRYGHIASSTNMLERRVNTALDVKSLSWISRVKDTKGKCVIIGPHRDEWALNEKGVMVYSLVKEIQGNDLGYIEIQNTVESLGKIFKSSDEFMKVIALDEESGELLYSSENAGKKDYSDLLLFKDGFHNSEDKKELICVSSSKVSGVRIFLMEDWSHLKADMRNKVYITIGAGFVFFFLALCFVILIADKLTFPLRQLREKMENTDWSNLSQRIEIVSADEDIQALTDEYQNLMLRLKTSMEKEKKMENLQIQAQFDTLQAQVNPHFLFNVLNIISNRGVMDEDEEICEICGSLAAMLRYSTSNVERYATVEKEMEYLNQYIYLLKSRYEQRLQVNIQWEPSINSKLLPKIVVQQLVENSIKHGFNNSRYVMEICVYGWQDEIGWYIEVSDNGQGITEEIRQKLNERMQNVRKKIQTGDCNLEMEIGGMGLINTYARLFLLYGEQAVFQIREREKGTSIVIGRYEEGKEK